MKYLLKNKFILLLLMIVGTCLMTLTPAYTSSLHAAPLQQTTATCNGTIYRDDNGNGAFDANEPLAPASRVEIYDLNETLLGQAVTDGQGNWSINGLPLVTQIRVQVKTPLPGGLIEGPMGPDSEVSVSGGPDWSCTLDYTLEFPGEIPINHIYGEEGPGYPVDLSWYYEDMEMVIQDIQLYYFCELISGDLMPGTAAPPIVLSIGNEFNSVNHQPETVGLASHPSTRKPRTPLTAMLDQMVQRHRPRC